jgi:hypothetical protein
MSGSLQNQNYPDLKFNIRHDLKFNEDNNKGGSFFTSAQWLPSYGPIYKLEVNKLPLSF